MPPAVSKDPVTRSTTGKSRATGAHPGSTPVDPPPDETSDQPEPSSSGSRPAGVDEDTWNSFLAFQATRGQSRSPVPDTSADALAFAIRSLTTILPTLSASQSSTPPSAPPAPRFTSVKLGDPDQFDGKPRSIRTFLNECESRFLFQKDAFVDNHLRCRYAGTLIASKCRGWFTKLLNTNSPIIHDWDLFKIEFTKFYGDPDQERTAMNRLQNLNQKSSVMDYASQFDEILLDLDLMELSKTTHFYEGLKSEVKDALTIVDRPDTLDSLQKVAIKMDNRIRARLQETRNKSKPLTTVSTYTPPSHSTPVSVSVQGSSAAHIDATLRNKPRGKLTEKEREERKAKGLCLYCGGGHMISDCPIVPQKGSGKAKPRS